MVLTLLIAVSAIVVPLLSNLTIGLGDIQMSPEQIATETTMQMVRRAILGDNGQKGLWQDLGEQDSYLPQSMADLFVLSSSAPPLLQFYDPNVKLGWRGPYLLSSGAQYGTPFGAGVASSTYGQPADPAVLDGWGRPIVIQYPSSPVTEPDRSTYVRLVSAGENGIIDTPLNKTLPALSECKDDIVLYLRVPDTRPR